MCHRGMAASVGPVDLMEAGLIPQRQGCWRFRIWLISRDGRDLCSDSVGEGRLAVTQPRRRVLTELRTSRKARHGQADLFDECFP
jgi:hypothetical protein